MAWILRRLRQKSTRAESRKPEVSLSRQIVIAVIASLLLFAGLIFKPEFFDLTSLLVTLGGALLVTYCSYSRAQLLGLWRAVQELIAGESQDPVDHLRELRRLNELFHLHGIRGLESQERHLKDDFTRFGVGMLVDMNHHEHIQVRLEQRQAWELAQSEVHRQILGGLARLLPAFGLIGTLIGMVQLLANLASVHHKTLPAALSLSVLTTLYGALTANMVVAPLAARLQTLATEKAAKMALTRDWLLTLARGDISSVPVQQKSLASRQEAVLPLLSEWQPAALATQRMTREAATH